MTMHSLLTRFPLFTFSILTFVVSWGSVLALFGLSGLPVTREAAPIAGIAVLLGTAFGGIFMTATTHGRAGLKRLISGLKTWRMDGVSASIALLAAPLTTLLAALLLNLMSPGHHPAIWGADDGWSMLLIAVSVGLVVAFFEELGWSGFAVPTLRERRSILTTGLVVGLLWGAWHFILFWQQDSFTDPGSFILLLAQLFSWLPAYRILLVFVYDRTGSLASPVIMHMMLVVSLMALEPRLAGLDLLIFILLRGSLLWALALAIAAARPYQVKTRTRMARHP